MKRITLFVLLFAVSFSAFSQDTAKKSIWNKVKTERQKKIDEANKKNEQSKTTTQKKGGIWDKINKDRQKKIDEQSTKTGNDGNNGKRDNDKVKGKDDDDDHDGDHNGKHKGNKNKHDNGKAWGRDNRWKHGKHKGDKNEHKHHDKKIGRAHV